MEFNLVFIEIMLKNAFFIGCLFVFFSLSFFLSDVLADEELVVEQAKLNTEDAGPVEVGHFEFETGYNFSGVNRFFSTSGAKESRGRLREHAVHFGLAMGLTEQAELNFEMGYVDLLDKEFESAPQGHGWTDLEIGSKILIYHSSEFDLSYAPSVVIPSGRESRSDRLGPGNDSTFLNQRGIFSKNWGRWNTNLDSGYALPIGNRKGNRGTWDANFAIGYQVFNWLQPAIEFNFAHDFVAHGDDADLFSMTGEFIMPLCDWVRVDLGVSQGLAGANTPQTTNVSVAITLFI